MPRSVVLIRIGVLTLMFGIGCSETDRLETSLLLRISSDIRVDEIVLRIRNIAYESDEVQKDLDGRDITVDEFVVLILPSSIIQNEFLVHARGFVDGHSVVAASAVYAFEENKRLDASIVLTEDFIDADNDGFASCNRDGCDCNDQNLRINPFTIEICDDYLDNNCSGLPIDEGCPCNPCLTPWRYCTTLPENLLHLAGIGECTFGKQLCQAGVWQTECVGDGPHPSGELPNNDRDDNCDGAVDEGSPCGPTDTTRPIFLGKLNADDTGLVLDSTGTGSNCRAGVQQCINGTWQTCALGGCSGEARPQRNPTAPGWIELPSDPSAGEVGQCDGQDNDCDGLVDDEPFFDGDHDGYTDCGTVIDGDPRQPTSRMPARGAEFIDCDGSNPCVNPGMSEDCRPIVVVGGTFDANCNFTFACSVDWTSGAELDDDCRCDHDPFNRPVSDSDSVIGKPRMDLEDLTTGVRPAAACSGELGHLSCNRDELPRSDANCVGSCADGPSDYCSTDGPYHHGYFESPSSHQDCYLCEEEFGYNCSDTTGSCTTKAEDCIVCDAPAPTADTASSLMQPLCTNSGPGCTELEGPTWVGQVGTDVSYECDEVSCAGYYCMLNNDLCYEKADQTADEVLCNGAETCERAADLCPIETQCKVLALEPPLCQRAVSGCSDTTSPVYQPQDNNTDQFNQCNDTFTCDSSFNGQGPFFHGIRNDSSDRAQCYLRANVNNSSCDGTGDCQTRIEACSSSGEGNIVSGRPLCETPGDGCSGETAPVYIAITDGSDPYFDCGTGRDGSTDLTCKRVGSNDSGECYDDLGDSCGSASDCQPGWSCTDGVCCNAECHGTCESCLFALTGQADGTCAPVVFGKQDADNCHDSTGCGGTGCQCDGDLSCKRGRGSDCSDANTCITDYCVDGYCCNSACTATCRACSAALTASANGTCAIIDQDTTDTVPTTLCSGSVGCNGGDCICEANTGACLRDRGDSCGSDEQCLSGHCANGTCCNIACDGNCDSCANSSGTCAAQLSVCTGNCDSCESAGSGYSCAPDNSGCGECGDCNGSGTDYNCESDQTECPGGCETCGGSGTSYTCSNLISGSSGSCTLYLCTGGSSCPSSCLTNSACSVTCIANICVASLSATGAACDDDDDCVSGNSCDGSICRRDNLQACTTNDQCVNTCIGGICSNLASTSGTCDFGDNNDCATHHSCVGTVCLLNNGQSCGDGTVCSSGHCADSTCCNSTCDGNCDSCATGSCIAQSSVCTGNCDVCSSSSGGYSCAANQATCLGACDSCTGSSTSFSCTPDADGSAGSPSCVPYYCDGAATSCPTSCAVNGDCTGPCIVTTCSATFVATGGACDEDADCSDSPYASSCDTDHICRRDTGQPCTAIDQCITNICSTTCRAS